MTQPQPINMLSIQLPINFDYPMLITAIVVTGLTIRIADGLGFWLVKRLYAYMTDTPGPMGRRPYRGRAKSGGLTGGTVGGSSGGTAGGTAGGGVTGGGLGSGTGGGLTGGGLKK